jgi:hypothetical protein
MRRTFARVAGVLGVMAVAGSCAQRPPGPADVQVTITCTPAGRVNVTVHGWVLHRARSETVVWHLVAAANVASITITPKDAALWPITPAPPYTIDRNSPFTATVSPDAASGTYSYTIEGRCTGSPSVIRIDPDIVVD